MGSVPRLIFSFADGKKTSVLWEARAMEEKTLDKSKLIP